MNAETFFAELKRRKVYSVAIAYVVAGWALAQGIAQVLPVFDIPNWVVRLLVVLIVLGFPVALTLSWFFDFTRYGIVRTPDRAPQHGIDAVDPSISQEKSIAVLPFKDLSAGPERDYLGEGIAEEILTALSKVDNLRVAARRSSFWFKDRDAELSEVASKLNVEHVVEGSIRRDGNRIRVTAELTECCEGFTLWSETFEREFQGIFALQDEITCAIVDALKLKLEIAPATPRAPQHGSVRLFIFEACSCRTKAPRKRCGKVWGFSKARSTKILDSHGPGQALRILLWLADGYVEPLEAYSKVREAAGNAINIDDSEAEAHVYLAETKRILDWDLSGAEAEYIRAFEMDSNLTAVELFYRCVLRGDRRPRESPYVSTPHGKD